MGKIAPYFVVATVDLVVILAVGSWLFGVPELGACSPGRHPWWALEETKPLAPTAP